MTRLAWAVVAIFLSVSAYGFVLNDEADQAAGLRSLSHGSLIVQERDHASTHGLPGNLAWESRWDHRFPVGSTALNLLALPVVGLLILLDALAPVGFWWAALWTIAIWRAVGIPAPWRGDPWRQAVAWATLVGAFLLASDFMRVQGPDARYFFAIIGLQVTNLVLAGLAALLLWKVLARPLPQVPGRSVAFLATILGSWLFWAKSAKYHMLAALLVVAILWCLQRPRNLRRDLGIGALAGLSLWVNVGVGAVVITALVLAELGRTWGMRRRLGLLGQQWMALAAGGLAGMSPMFVENQVLFGNPFFSFYHAGAAPGLDEGAATAVGQSAVQTLGILERVVGWEGLVSHGLDLLSIFTIGHRIEKHPDGILLITPFLAFAAFALRSWRRWDDSLRWAFSLLLMQAVLMTKVSTEQGGGFDVRMWFHVIPGLSLLAATGLAHWLNSLTASVVRRGSQTAALFLLSNFIGLWLVNSLGYEIGLGRESQSWTFLQLIRFLALMLALMGVALHVLRWRVVSRPGAICAVAFLLVVPLAWAILFLVANHTTLPNQGEHDGGGTFVPGMDSLGRWMHGVIDPPSPLPIVYDAEGNLLFHPDYGRCDIEPWRCPPGMKASWAANTTASPSP